MTDREYDGPDRRRWTSDRLDDRFASIATELGVLRPLPGEIARAHQRIDALVDNIREIKDAIRDFRSEYRQDRDRAEQATHSMHGRTAVLWAAGIGAAATVLGSLALAIVTIIGGGG